ncbi:MAG: DAK2 domain-containing protein [[Clostridium] scindens]
MHCCGARARDTAYKAVMKPKEGTILTVASGIAKKRRRWQERRKTWKIHPGSHRACRGSVEKTPDMLPVLKEAGVVDSGGQGLLK